MTTTSAPANGLENIADHSGTLAETWLGVDLALRRAAAACREIVAAQLLAEWRGVRNIGRLPPFQVERILAWADAHYQRVARAEHLAGAIADAAGETWLDVDKSITGRQARLEGGSSLARLLASSAACATSWSFRP